MLRRKEVRGSQRNSLEWIGSEVRRHAPRLRAIRPRANPTKGETALIRDCKNGLLGLCAGLLTLAAMPGALAQLPADWKAQDVNDPEIAGSTTCDAATGTYTIQAGG